MSIFFTMIRPSITFSNAVFLEKRLNPWNTILVFFLSSTSDFLSLRARSTLRSPMLMLPLSGFSNLFRQRKNVDFPVPDGPMIATTSPLLMFRSMPFKTTLLLNFLEIFFTSIIGSMPPHLSVLPVHSPVCGSSSQSI